MTDVRLVDLEVIKRYSLAVRRDTVPADELLSVLDASRTVVLAALGAADGAPTAARTPRKPKATATKTTKATPTKTTKATPTRPAGR